VNSVYQVSSAALGMTGTHARVGVGAEYRSIASLRSACSLGKVDR